MKGKEKEDYKGLRRKGEYDMECEGRWHVDVRR
jgi:hypothetical protein